MTREVPADLTLQAAVIDLASGNPGALSVLMELINTNRSDLILYLYEEEIRGPDLWIWYKDQNGEDIDELAKDIELQRMARDG